MMKDMNASSYGRKQKRGRRSCFSLKMKAIFLRGAGALPLCALAAAVLPGGPAVAQSKSASPAAASVILDGITIVNTRDGSLQPNMALRIEGGKITRIGRAHTLKPSDHEILIDASAKYVVPGYLDMHTHVLNLPAPQAYLALMVANGVTGYRQMNGSPQLMSERREGKLPIGPVAPELLALPGPILAGNLASDPRAAVAEVAAQKAEGADFIKVIDLQPAAFFAALDEATAVGLTFGGHLPPTVDVREAARRGMRNIEHLGPRAAMLDACSTDEVEIRKQIAATPPALPNLEIAPALLRRLNANPLLFITPIEVSIMQRTIDTYSEPKCRALAKLIVASNMWQVPTLNRNKTTELANESAFRNDPNLKYISTADRDMWQDVANQFVTKLPPATRTTLADFVPLQLKVTKLFDDMGVKMMTGTDTTGQWVIPGISLHYEFDLLEQAGLPPLHILQMATLNGAEFLGKESSMGTVEVGKNADLVVLDANPIVSAENLHKINAVVRSGTYYSRKDLDDIAHAAEQH